MTQARPRQPDEVDQIVGNKVREVRKSRGLTMKQLASHLGVSYQQVQKYEIGSNRIPVSRLASIASLLKVSPGMFYDLAPTGHMAEGQPFGATSPLSIDEERLLTAFAAISSPEAKKSLLAVADQMAQSSKEADAAN